MGWCMALGLGVAGSFLCSPWAVLVRCQFCCNLEIRLLASGPPRTGTSALHSGCLAHVLLRVGLSCQLALLAGVGLLGELIGDLDPKI